MSLCSYEFIFIAVLFNVCNLEQGSDDDEKEDQKKKLEKRRLTFEGAASHQKILEISESLSLDADGGESDDDGSGTEDDNEFLPNIPEYPVQTPCTTPPKYPSPTTVSPKHTSKSLHTYTIPPTPAPSSRAVTIKPVPPLQSNQPTQAPKPNKSIKIANGKIKTNTQGNDCSK